MNVFVNKNISQARHRQQVLYTVYMLRTRRPWFYKTCNPLSHHRSRLILLNQGSFQHHQPSPLIPRSKPRIGLTGIGSVVHIPPFAKSSAAYPPVVVSQKYTNKAFPVHRSHRGNLYGSSVGKMTLLNVPSIVIPTAWRMKNINGPNGFVSPSCVWLPNA